MDTDIEALALRRMAEEHDAADIEEDPSATRLGETADDREMDDEPDSDDDGAAEAERDLMADDCDTFPLPYVDEAKAETESRVQSDMGNLDDVQFTAADDDYNQDLLLAEVAQANEKVARHQARYFGPC